MYVRVCGHINNALLCQFREMVLTNYRTQFCVVRLPIASHARRFHTQLLKNIKKHEISSLGTPPKTRNNPCEVRNFSAHCLSSPASVQNTHSGSYEEQLSSHIEREMQSSITKLSNIPLYIFLRTRPML
jgi:hypothetical protein